MKPKCHACGREYLAARALVGKSVACRSCGALNDGAGGPPPVQPERASSSVPTARASSTAASAPALDPRIGSGAEFTVGRTEKPADPARVAAFEINSMRAKLAATEANSKAGSSRAIFALGIGIIAVTVIVIGGIFVYRGMLMPDRGIDWSHAQRAVASLSTPSGDGSAFLVESNHKLWLVSTFDVIASSAEVAATFRDPETGAETLRLAGIGTRYFLVDPRFFSESDAAKSARRDAPNYLLVATDINMFRSLIEAHGIEPLAIGRASDVRIGSKVVALGQQAAVFSADGSTGRATHALFDGAVSSVEFPASSPSFFQSSALFGDGCSGGPLLLESTREVAGVQLDPANCAGRRIAILASQLTAVLEQGMQLGEPQPSAQASAPATPRPAVPQPSAPASQPPVIAPPNTPAPLPRVIPPLSAGGLASIVEVDPSYCNGDIYASSILGLAEFDRRFVGADPVTSPARYEELSNQLIQSDQGNQEVQEIIESVRAASLGWTIDRFIRSRPVTELLFTVMPPGRKVSVYAEFGAHGALELLPVGKAKLVSRSADAEPNSHGRLTLEFPWINDGLLQLRAAVDIPFELVVRYDDGSEDRVTHRIRIHPTSDVEMAYPCGLAVAALVNESHPYVRRIINEINQDPELLRARVSLTGTGGAPQDQLLSVYLIWKELVRRGLRYQNLTGSELVSAQRVRPVHEALSDRNANCLDGAVLLSSFLEAIGFETHVILLPGHAIVAAQIVGGPFLSIEATMLDHAVATDPTTDFDEDFEELRTVFRFTRNQSALHQFESACEAGLAAVEKGLAESSAVLEEWNALTARGPVQLPDGSWRPEAAELLNRLSRQLLFVKIQQARSLGVHPIGVPPDLERRYPLPK